MTQRISILRIFGAMAAATLHILAVISMVEYRRADRRFWESVNARPMTVVVDLSQPGTFFTPFNQTRQSSHGENFYLTISPPAGLANKERLKDLEGTITIKDSEGKEVETLEINPDLDPSVSTDVRMILANFPPFPVGQYTAAIHVKQGAPALRGIPQTIHAEYRLCGCENLAFVSAIIAFVLGIPGIIIGLHVTYGFLNHGWRVPPKRHPTRWLPQ